MKLFITILKHWLPLAFLSTCICGLVYAAVQQNYRQSANDPQIQMAEDAVTLLEAGAAAQSFSPIGTVDIGASLAPYVLFYDEAGAPVAGNGFLSGQLPALPQGVFDYARAVGEDRITWQPAPGVRSAIVVAHASTGTQGFVMVGRSLREVERRENALGIITFAAWVLSLIGTFVLEVFALSSRPYGKQN